MKIIAALAKLIALPLALPCLLRYALLAGVVGRERALASCSEAIGRRPGLLGVYSRQWFYNWVLARVGTGVHFGFLSLFSKTAAEVGDRVYIGRFCTLGWVKLGDDVMLADGVQVLSGRHQHGDPGAGEGQTRREAAQSFSLVAIGAGAWIGAGAIVMADVGAGAVVAAGAVVVNPVPAGMKVGGVPAKPLE